MTRRQALLMALALPLADVRVLARQGKRGEPLQPAVGNLVIPLDQWHTLTFRYRDRTVEYTTAEIFAVLKGEKS